VVGDAIEVLDACAEDWRGVRRIGDLGAASAGELKAFRGMFLDELLLGGSKGRPNEVQNRAVFDFAVVRGVLAGKMDDVFALGGADFRDMVLREGSSQKVHARDPLFHRVVPLVEGEV